MLFHLWLFTVQSHKRLHSVTLFSSQTGHPYFRAESSENIDGLRYCGFVWSKPTTAWYLQLNLNLVKLRTSVRNKVYMSLFLSVLIYYISHYEQAQETSEKVLKKVIQQLVPIRSCIANCKNINTS